MNIRYGILLIFSLVFLGAGCSQLGALPDTENTGTKLDLSGSGLTSVPSNVFGLTELEELNLSSNSLTGALPSQINQLVNLRILDASQNEMTGVPSEIGQLTKLETLDLSDNQLTGLPNELGNLTNLQILDLRGNTISQLDLDGIRAKLTTTQILE
jgi:leucine-rich repeat protein SHOC2